MLGYEVVRLARGADPFRAVISAAGRPLDQLRDATGESALLAVPVGRTEMEIVLQLDASHIVGVTDWVGVHPPLHASSAGKLLLAELSEPEIEAWLADHTLQAGTDVAIHDEASLRDELRRVRQRGWAAIVDELEVGLTSISAAVRDHDGVLVGMLGISGPTFRLGPRRRREVLALRSRRSRRLDRSLVGDIVCHSAPNPSLERPETFTGVSYCRSGDGGMRVLPRIPSTRNATSST